MNLPKKYLAEHIILTEARIDNKSILRILTQDTQINRADPNYNYYVQLANWANGKQEKTGKIDLSTIKLSNDSLIQKGKLAKNTKHLGATLEQLKNLMDQEGKYNPNSQLSQLIQLTTLEILANLSGIKTQNRSAVTSKMDDTKVDKLIQPDLKPKELVTEKPTVAKALEIRDWTAEKAKRLANANGTSTSEILDTFYDDYYSQEFARVDSPEQDTKGIVTKLKSLSTILVKEFHKLGYNPEVNPLAQFLKILIQERPEIFKKLTTNTYGAIHNSYVDHKVTGNELGNYNKKHLLFCEDLYNLKGLEIVKYLSLYRETLNTAKKQSEDAFTLAAKLFIQQDLDSLTSSDGTQQTFTTKVTKLINLQEVQFPASEKAKLRTLPEIEELYTYIFKVTPSSTKATENKTIKLLIDSAKNENAILDMIYYIANNKAFNSAYQKEAIEALTQLKELQYQKNEERIVHCKQELELHQQKLSKDDWQILLKKLFAAYRNSAKKAGS